MGKSLTWQHVGPAREETSFVPPISVGNYSYALAYDAARGVTVYSHARDYGNKNDWYTWDGTAWTKSKGKAPDVENETHSFYDASRGGIATWCVGESYDYDLERTVPHGTIATAKGAAKIKTKGEPPLIEADSEDTFFTSNEVCVAMTYDAGRDVTVCLTRRGVWELDTAGTWERKHDGKGIAQEWSNDSGGVYNPVGKRCVLFFQGTANKYKHVFYAWDGETLEKLPLKGLPDLCRDMFDPCALFAGHPKHGVICQIGDKRGAYALGAAGWTKLPDAANPPPTMTGLNNCRRPHMTYDEKQDALVIGPGYYEQDRGGGDAQRVFWTRRGTGAWERFGAVGFPSPIAELYGRHHAVADGVWYATNKRGLHTMKLEPGAGDWIEIASDKAGEKLLGHDSKGALVASPDGLLAVSDKGAVFKLAGKAWKQIAKASKVFKDRSDFTIAHDDTRIVVWGGEVKNRKSNDTLIFADGKWTVPKTTSPTPKLKDANESPEYQLVYDTTLQRVLRFGWTEVAVLEGDVWKAQKPKGYAPGARWWDHFAVHDPKTGETLVVDFTNAKIMRFDLGGCTALASYTYPKDVKAWAELESSRIDYYFTEDCVFDPATRSLYSQKDDDKYARSKLDLGPIFDAAKKLGPRKLVDAAKPAAANPAKGANAAKPAKGANAAKPAKKTGANAAKPAKTAKAKTPTPMKRRA